MKIIVFGPTGGTGQLLLEKATQSGHSVTAFTRNTSAIEHRPDLTILAGSVLDADAVAIAVAGQDAVLSALGGRPWRTSPICGPAIRNITAAMAKHRLRRIVAISTLGAAETRADIGWFARNVLFRFVLRNEVADKEAMEEHLSATDLTGSWSGWPHSRTKPRVGPFVWLTIEPSAGWEEFRDRMWPTSCLHS
jgi:hypothetical protein